MAGWHHRLDGHESERAPGVGGGRGGLACCGPWGRRVRHTQRLNNLCSECVLQRGVAVWPRSPRQSGRGPGGTRSSGPGVLGPPALPSGWGSGTASALGLWGYAGMLCDPTFRNPAFQFQARRGASGTQTGDKQTVVGPPGQGQPPRTRVAWLPDQSVAFGRDGGPGRRGPPPAPAPCTLPTCTPPAAPASLLLTPQSSPCLLQAP